MSCCSINCLDLNTYVYIHLENSFKRVCEVKGFQAILSQLVLALLCAGKCHTNCVIDF